LNPAAPPRKSAAIAPESDKQYEAEFRDAGLAVVGELPAAIAEGIQASPIRSSLVAALDDWAICTPDESRRAWILAIAQETDPHPWRHAVRDSDPNLWADRKRLVDLRQHAVVEQESVQLLGAIADRMQAHGDNDAAIAFLKRVQSSHPTDFYANYLLGYGFMVVNQEGNGVEYFRTATTMRPDAPTAWYGLGTCLYRTWRLDEAETALLRCISLDPAYGLAHRMLGMVYRGKYRSDDAIKWLKSSVQLTPRSVMAYTELARAYQQKEQGKEAIDCLREAVRLRPDMGWANYDLGMALNSPGSREEAISYLSLESSALPCPHENHPHRDARLSRPDAQLDLRQSPHRPGWSLRLG
jgi:serine/threonine-protein kinase